MRHDICIPDHAVDRLRERGAWLSASTAQAREVIEAHVKAGVRRKQVEKHWREGQVRVPICVLGVELYAILTRDRTGFARSGWAVITLLEPRYVRRREAQAA